MDSQSPASGVTAELARFVADTRYEDVPADVIELGRKSILDGLGLALAGSVAESGHIVERYLGTLTGGTVEGGATVIGTKLRVAPRFAAFANGIAIHADDFDDTQLAVAKDRVYGLLMHPTAPVLPAALAVAEAGGLSGKAMMLAYQIGIETSCKVAEAIAPRHYQDGFHTTATCGTFGAAAAAASLRGLDDTSAAKALGLAGTQSAGLRENFGTMTKPFHPGRSSESGVIAVDLIELGWSAASNLLEAKRGFYSAAGGGFDAAAISGKLGAPWTFANPGISIKPHPSGSLTHPGMSELLRLIVREDIKPEEVEQVRVGTNRHMPTTLLHHKPTNELQAKFSMQFSMAILLLRRKAGLLEYTDEVVRQQDVQQMMAKVDFYVDPVAEAAGYDKMTTIIEIRLKGGRSVTGRADFGKGSPADPMSYDEIVEKFLGCAAYAGWPAAKADAIVDAVNRLEKLESVGELTRFLTSQSH
jgi:2-methylcitrate dehydratase PrpD